MTQLTQPPLEFNQFQLTSKHRVKFDKLAVTITTASKKKDSDELVYGNAKHYGSIESLLNRLKSIEFMSEISEPEKAKTSDILEAITSALQRVEDTLNEVKEHVKEHIDIDLGDSKKVTSKKE